jgi:transposase
MLRLTEGTHIYVAAAFVDFRKAINGLIALVMEQFETPVNDGSVYVFYNRDCDRVKCLFWDKNGFVLYHKRLERG